MRRPRDVLHVGNCNKWTRTLAIVTKKDRKKPSKLLKRIRAAAEAGKHKKAKRLMIEWLRSFGAKRLAVRLADRQMPCHQRPDKSELDAIAAGLDPLQEPTSRFSRRWEGFVALINNIRSLGYHVRDEVLDAAHFGVPQTRRRFYILCDRDRVPRPVVVPCKRLRTADEIINQNGAWASKPLLVPGRAKATIERAERAIGVLGKRVPFLIVYYGSDGAGGWQSINRPLRTLTTLDRFGLVTWEGSEPMLRMLQVEELRQAMGFPSSYQFAHGTRRDKIKLIGNAVCPPVMNGIISSVLER